MKATIGLGGNFVEEGEYLATWSGSGHILFQGDAALLKTSGNTAYVKARAWERLLGSHDVGHEFAP